MRIEYTVKKVYHCVSYTHPVTSEGTISRCSMCTVTSHRDHNHTVNLLRCDRPVILKSEKEALISTELAGEEARDDLSKFYKNLQLQ